MGTDTFSISTVDNHLVHLRLSPALSERNRLTTAFRLVLAIPHLILVGAPIAAVLTWRSGPDAGVTYGWGGSGGLLGAAVVMAAVIAWFAILFTARYIDRSVNDIARAPPNARLRRRCSDGVIDKCA